MSTMDHILASENLVPSDGRIRQYLLVEVLLEIKSYVVSLGYTRITLILFAVQTVWTLYYAFFRSPLRHIPAPFLARVTSSRIMIHLLTGRAEAASISDYKQHGDVYLSKPNTVSICDPKDARVVLSNTEFRKTDMYRVFEYEGIPNVSTFTDPAQANQRRSQLHPFFTVSYLAGMEHLILKYGSKALRTRWDTLITNNEVRGEDTIINYRSDTQLAMFDITGALAFGRDFHALQEDNLVYTKWVNNTLTYMLLSHYFPFIKRKPFSALVWKLKGSYDDLVQFSKESVAIRQEEIHNGGDIPADLLQALLDARDLDVPGKTHMSPEEVQAESIAMLVGGSESTSSVISWIIHFLLLYPEHFDRVRDEVRAGFPDMKTVITYQQCRELLPYLECVIYETLRCIPTTSTSFPRVSDTKGITIKGFYIPPGTEIATNKCAAHVHATTWQDPDKFDPTRFLNNFETKRNMLSFAYGTRFCIGRNLAWVVMMVTIANLFRDYDIKLPKDSVFGPHNKDPRTGRPRIMPTKLGVATMPAKPERDCRMILQKRKDRVNDE
ncbi:putative cytochrome P450 monooxygenase [Pseudovirgaria hyperparasitica]|uniref:Putative cytochrome P450 monooxygenase n=1 Tax=Pseudovirgaria hyperparasitica TaxID=470096 RepID=A0A6A6VW40_9PEZI|nr:putative cytochrome P450 monooxygenase [Pseudovirgaria hyperparasitica]KAF2753860.1 putative cytochrome P450 monooxygenase [Pseudovirgaria hyperparasitica]